MVPKIVTEHERTLTRQAIIKQTKNLIANKQGIKNIIVDDIARAVGIAKGSFYSYFPSKEACIYEVIANAYETDLMHLKQIMAEHIPLEVKIEKFINNIFLGADGIDRHIAPQEYEILLRKLPPEYMIRDESEAKTTVAGMMEILTLSQVQTESLLAMLDCIRNVINAPALSIEVKEESTQMLTKTIAAYIKEKSQSPDLFNASGLSIFPMENLLWLSGY